MLYFAQNNKQYHKGRKDTKESMEPSRVPHYACLVSGVKQSQKVRGKGQGQEMQVDSIGPARDSKRTKFNLTSRQTREGRR